MTKIVKQKIKVLNMHCTACALSIDMDLEELDGVASVKTSFARSETEIEFDLEKLDTDSLLSQIKKTGYRAEVKA